jgi:murein DD-endopeptidase MepM/ murein hydrolase activator NlpD
MPISQPSAKRAISSDPTRRSPRLARAAAILVAPVLAVLLIESGSAGAASMGELQQQIGAGQSQISSLSGQVGAASNRLSALNSNIGALEQRISGIQADLRAHQAEMARLGQELAAAKRRLAQLEAFEIRAEDTLSRMLINNYETSPPDLVSVVLQATGFQNLLERLSFAQRIQKQDTQVTARVKAARRAVAAQAVRLGALEVRQRAIASQIFQQETRLLASRSTLVKQRLGVAQIRSRAAGQLSDVRGQVAGLQHQLAQAQAAQAAQAAAAARAAQAAQSSSPTPSSPGPSTPSSSGPPPSAPSSSGFVFPLPKSAASPPSTWSPDQGVDISAPGNTPEYAVCSGTIVLHGIGGFGPWAPVLHCDSPLDGYDYVYYGHAGPLYQLPVGTHVGAGQVMSSIGPGIVGISTGPHLEIGFADSSGSPIGAQTAGTMLSLLQASY